MKSRRPTRLPRWHEWSIYGAFGALLITGVAWLVFDKWVRVAGEFGAEHHPAEHTLIILHGLAAYAFLIVAGALIPVHVKVGWSTSRNRVSGIALASILIFLGVTALGLYYIGGDTSRDWDSLAHWTVGIVAFPAFLVHLIRGLSPVTPPPAKFPRRRGRPRRDG